MPADQVVLLAIGLIVIAAVAVTVAYATAHTRRATRPRADDGDVRGGARQEQTQRAAKPVENGSGSHRSGASFVAATSTRQVARVVAFLFLASVAIVVALTGAWPDTEPAVFTLLAAGTLLVVLFMDMVSPSALGRWRRPVEGVGAIVFLGLLMALTGGTGSPFFVGFFLVVAGTALATEGFAPLLIALVAAGTIAVVGIGASFEAAIEPEGMAWIGFNAVALILLADVATAAARAQRHARDEALRASRFDALTGLYNRSFFFTTVEQEIRRSERMGRGFTLLMLDLDDLKPVNDTFGHQWGDRLLRAIADIIRQTIRFTDAAARYGGDEFVILLPETDAAGGYVVGEKLRRDIAALAMRAGDRNVRSSVSVGLVAFPEDGETLEQLVAAADLAMYESKRRGKNRIVGYQMRTERVAMPIDAASAPLVQLESSAVVRTGGDPAPWLTPPAGEDEDAAPESRTERPNGGGGSRRGARIPVEPDADGATWPGAPVSQGARAAGSPMPTAGTEGHRATKPPAAGGGRSIPAPGSGTGGPSVEDPGVRGGGSGSGDAALGPGRRAGDRPWLTRTDAPAEPPGPLSSGPQPPGSEPPGREPPTSRAPGSARRESPRRHPDARGGERDGSRRSEISSGERPWIVLPIEPLEPPDRPKG